MKQKDLNFYIDIVSAVCFLSLAGTGVITHFVLPPRSGHASFLGLTRHDWGDVHFWIAAFFSVIIIVHLVLHWKWLKAMFFKRLAR